jgi:poly-gamma-glutamate capsule biosynthesis protein CapA/YwtB (metallophosphatase superfamily)
VARAAGIDDGGYTGADAENIRIHAEGAETFHEMEMNIDQSRRNNMIFDLDDLGAVGWKPGVDGVNDALAHAHVEEAIAATRRVDQSAAFQEKVK